MTSINTISDKNGVSDEERDLLRRSVRDYLADIWPADKAVERINDTQALATLWPALAQQGLSSLGCDDAGVGLREIVLVFEELGRAAAPAPLLGAIAANLALSGLASNAAQVLLDDLHHGKAAFALALGAFDGDAAAGAATVRDDGLHGTLAFVEGIETATHILVFTASPSGVAVVTRDASGLTVTATPGLAVPPYSQVTFEGTPALRFDMAGERLDDVAQIARLACAARALGSAQRAFDLAVEHVKVRKQFGQFVGQFQAIQHKLANGLINLDGARLAIDHSAKAYDEGNRDWRIFAASAVAFAGPALRATAVETQRALGAIGYAEEHEAPRHFRRVHADLVRFGGTPRARAQLADFLLGAVS